jgi:hypothetical protein
MKGAVSGEFGAHGDGDGLVLKAPRRATTPPKLVPSCGVVAVSAGVAEDRHPPEAVVPGLPADVMDECVEDLAEAVVAILLSQAAVEPDDDEHASGDLRKV